jgi:hypothetical protein
MSTLAQKAAATPYFSFHNSNPSRWREHTSVCSDTVTPTDLPNFNNTKKPTQLGDVQRKHRRLSGIITRDCVM